MWLFVSTENYGEFLFSLHFLYWYLILKFVCVIFFYNTYHFLMWLNYYKRKFPLKQIVMFIINML